MHRLTRPSEIQPYLNDASQFSGSADGVALPGNEQEISEFLSEANTKKIPVTISAGRTGLAGAAVLLGGWVLSTEKFSRILEVKKGGPGEASWARAEPGVCLKNLNQTLEKDSIFYPPDPTGPKALIGGTLATNASGPNSFKYGPTRPYVRRIRSILPDGEVLDLRRGQVLASQEGVLEIPKGNQKLRIRVPHYAMPRVKHAGGYFVASTLDAVDLFIGSEGTLGVITEIEVTLLPKPPQVLAFIVFFRNEEDSWRFSRSARELSLRNREGHGKTGLEARALEYFDGGALDFLRPNSATIPEEARALIFVEQEVGHETAEALSKKWRKFFEKEKALDDVWEARSPEKQKEFRDFRSKLPLAVKDFLAEHGQIKIGTDTCVPPERFEELMLFHRQQVEASGLLSVTFGHIGEAHVHLNLLPRNEDEATKGRALYPILVDKAVVLGGTFSAEHGVGKLKRVYLARLCGDKAIEEMKEIKRVFDPNGILGRGNIFEL